MSFLTHRYVNLALSGFSQHDWHNLQQHPESHGLRVWLQSRATQQ